MACLAVSVPSDFLGHCAMNTFFAVPLYVFAKISAPAFEAYATFCATRDLSIYTPSRGASHIHIVSGVVAARHDHGLSKLAMRYLGG